MSPQLSELEAVLRQQIAEYRRLLAQVEKHEAGMKAFDLNGMNDAARQQESSRQRLAQLEQRRRTLAGQIARGMNLPGEPTLAKLAAMEPGRAQTLLQLRGEFKVLIEQIAARTYVAGKVASSVLGHLNTVVRLLAGVVERAGLYTKQGIPRASSRIGVMDTVG